MTDPTSDRSELSDTSPASGHTVQSPDSLTHYLDFEVEIGIGLGREYPISVLRSPAGEARETMHFPFDELALDNRLKDLQIALLRSGGQRRQLLSPEEQAVQIFGRELFNSLLAGEARSLYDVSCNVAKQQGRGLRLKLRILPPELAQLPWEFLYDSRQAEFVCMSRDTPVVRYLELPHPVQPLAVTPPLRVLGMTASPRDLPALDLAREKQRVEEAIGTLQSNSLLELTWLEGSTWRDLQRAMRGGPWHIFHFVGHGGFDRNADEGLIVLEDERGLTHRLLATDLGRLLSDHHSLRLTLLNSCEGARGGEHDIFSSTAAILVRRGIPAVLAMQYEITDRAAIEFARAFYEALTDGLPVDGAVAEARKAVGLAVPNTVEWGTPVLYMRAPQGMIFQMPSTPSTKRVSPKPSVPPRIDKELAQRLQQLYTDGLSAYWVEDWDKACSCFQAIVESKPDYQDAAAKLTSAQRQLELSSLYTQAQTAVNAKDWVAALAVLEPLAAEAPNFKDAAALLDSAKRERQLSALYAEARQLYEAKQWLAVVNVFTQILALQPDFADSDGLLSSAQREAEAVKRQAGLNSLYARALHALDSGRWQEAVQLFTEVKRTEPNFRDTDRLLSTAQEQLARQEAEQSRQEQITTLYEQALGLARARQWRQALAKTQEIRKLDAQFADPENIAARAQVEIEREDQEAQRQSELAAMYAEAVRLLKASKYQEALEKWRAIQAIEPRYPDRNKVQETAGRKLAELQKPALAKRKEPRWIVALVSGVIVLAVVAVVGLLSSKDKQLDEPTPTSLPIAVVIPTETSSPATDVASLPMPVPTTTAVPTVSTPATMTLRIGVTSTSDWAKVMVVATGGVLGSHVIETTGTTSTARMAGNVIDLQQSLEGSEAGNTVGMTVDVDLNKASRQVRMSLTKGCNGITAVEVFNVVASPPVSIARQTYYDCASLDFNVSSDNLVTGNPIPGPTPHPGETLYQQGVLALRRKAYDEAMSLYDQALAAGWKIPQLYFDLGWLHRNREDYKTAISDYDKALELDASFYRAYRERGYVYCMNLGDQARGLVEIDKALKLAPENEVNYSARGICYEGMQQWEKAIGDFTQVISMDPTSGDAYGHRGHSYQQLGQIANARADYLKFIQMTEGNPDYRDWRRDVQTWLAQHPE